MPALLTALLPLFLYGAWLAGAWWLLTLRRTAPTGVLLAFASLGGILFLVREPLEVLAALGLFGAALVATVDLAVVLAPLAALAARGRGFSLYDGMALGAFLGLGWALTAGLAGPHPPGSPLAWPPGAGYAVLAPGSFPAWGALVGLAAFLARRGRGGLALAAVLLAFLWAERLFFGQWPSGRLAGPLAPLGGAGGIVLLAALGLAWVVEDRQARRGAARLEWARLEGEAGPPSMGSEARLLLAAAGGGPGRLRATARFLSRRRRVLLEGADPDPAASLRLAEARAALEGEPPAPWADPRWQGYLRGQAGVVVLPVAWLVATGTLGAFLTVARGEDPWGFMIAVAVVTAALYPVQSWWGGRP